MVATLLLFDNRWVLYTIEQKHSVFASCKILTYARQDVYVYMYVIVAVMLAYGTFNNAQLIICIVHLLFRNHRVFADA